MIRFRFSTIAQASAAESVRRAALVAIFAIFVAIRLANLTTFCLDSDEVFSVRVASLAWPAMFDAVARDAVHPPLFYVLLKLWLGIGGESRLWLRLLPFAFAIAAAPLFLLLCRRLAPRPGDSALAFLFLAANPYHVFHSQYVRMYSLLFLLSLCSMLAFDALLRDRENTTRSAALLAAANIALVYTHYFGWLLVAAEVGYAAASRGKRWMPALGASAAALLCAAPWLWMAAGAAAAKGGLSLNLGWIARPGLAQFFWHVAGLNGPIRPYALAIALIAPFTVVLVAGLRSAWLRDGAALRMPLALALAPPLMAFVASNVAPHAVWESRYLMVAAAPYFVLMAIAIGSLGPRARRFAAPGAAVFLLYGAVQLSMWPEPRVDIEAVARRIAARPAPAYSFDRPLAYTLQYFVRRHGEGAVMPAKAGAAIHCDNCWIVTTNHCCRAILNPVVMLEKQGYRRAESIQVRDEWNEITAVRFLPAKKTAPAEP
jgi:4-amino-4-deoxy-L-arabinose transferase-like glycosyltransferase